MKDDVQFNHPNVDLVVAPSLVGNYQKPWGEKNTSGNFKSWNWQRISPTEASYLIGKWIPSGDIEELTLKAVCLWPK